MTTDISKPSRATSLAAAALVAVSLSAPVTAQDTPEFQQAFTAFVRACVDPAPSFRATERAAQPFGFSSFTFKPQLENSNEFGMNYGYNFPIGNARPGNPVPRQAGQLAISYTTKYRQIDRMCAVVFLPDNGVTKDQMQASFQRSVQAYQGSEGDVDERSGLISYTVDDFDYEFSAVQAFGSAYLYLHVWE